MRSLRKAFLLVLFLNCTAEQLSAQQMLSGTVFDSSKKNLVEGVKVQSTGGNSVLTDSMGRYSILVNDKDSLSFIYRNKPTQKFAVTNVPDPSHFDIALHVSVKGKYTTMKEVVVFGKSYRQDSMENRQTYAEAFEFRKPTIRSSINLDGAVGADVNEIINIFRFKRNKRLKNFQARLEKQEEDKYVAWRFNKTFVRRITQLEGEQLDEFMIRYVPSYEFASQADEITFNTYVLNASYQYKIELLKKQTPKLPADAKN